MANAHRRSLSNADSSEDQSLAHSRFSTINTLDTSFMSEVCKFADDAALGANAANPAAVESLRQDLDNQKMVGGRQMPLNSDKCTVIHIVRANGSTNYSPLGIQIPTTSREKNIGIYIISDPKFSKQCIDADKRANKSLGYTGRRFKHSYKEMVLTLCNTLTGGLLEYDIQFWSPL